MVAATAPATPPARPISSARLLLLASRSIAIPCLRACWCLVGAEYRARVNRTTGKSGGATAIRVSASAIRTSRKGGSGWILDRSAARSRRALLLGAAASVAALIATPLRLRAAADQVRYVNDEDNETVLSATSVSHGAGTGQGTGILGSSVAGRGVGGESESGIGVQGISRTRYGVQGVSTADNGVYGCSDSGIGVHGSSASQAGVFGISESGIGVIGESSSGRGGRFVGEQAQLQLVPAPATQHPVAGTAGDIFVDGRARLWFCRGGGDWVRLA